MRVIPMEKQTTVKRKKKKNTLFNTKTWTRTITVSKDGVQYNNMIDGVGKKV